MRSYFFTDPDMFFAAYSQKQYIQNNKKTAMWNSLFLTVIGEETILIFRRRM